MRIAGLIIGMIGFLLCLTIIGAVIGIPLMIIGAGMMLFGGRKKTIINNVITVQNAPATPEAIAAPSSASDMSRIGPGRSRAAVDFKIEHLTASPQ